jgi:hypothetical protein
VLKAAVGHLDPGGAYEVLTDDPTPPMPGDKLKITNSWVLYARKRTGGPFLDDVRQLKKTVEAAKTLPAVIISLVEHGAMHIQERGLRSFRGLSSSDGTVEASELYFPMVYNDEQVSIVQKLEHSNGVVVRGPPGTGKTHTIANIICHYLAQGKRVLVTSRGEPALNEVIGKLPERIRHALRGVVVQRKRWHEEVRAFDPDHCVERLGAQRASGKCRNRIPARKAQPPSQVDEHQWLDDDLHQTDNGGLPFGDADINRLRHARIKIGSGLAYLNCSVPSPDEFPAWTDLAELHRDLGRSKAIETDLVAGAVLNFKDSSFETFESARRLAVFLDERLALKRKVSLSVSPDLAQLSHISADASR